MYAMFHNTILYALYRAPWCHSFRGAGGQVKTINQQQKRTYKFSGKNNIREIQFRIDVGREFQTDALQCWGNILCRKTFVWKELAVVELTTIAVTTCCCVSWCVVSDTHSGTDVCMRPACTWCVAPPAANVASAAASWHEIVVTPDLRLSPCCFVLSAASEWCRMELRKTRQHLIGSLQTFVFQPASEVTFDVWKWNVQLL